MLRDIFQAFIYNRGKALAERQTSQLSLNIYSSETLLKQFKLSPWQKYSTGFPLNSFDKGYFKPWYRLGEIDAIKGKCLFPEITIRPYLFGWLKEYEHLKVAGWENENLKKTANMIEEFINPKEEKERIREFIQHGYFQEIDPSSSGS